ncbi:MAG: DUF2806 domain-containing protein [Candidatus Saccharibacteria bacterium]|nr:DUF2806 domain-containing protein [Candidatus Saccharibacteria bacterium]
MSGIKMEANAIGLERPLVCLVERILNPDDIRKRGIARNENKIGVKTRKIVGRSLDYEYKKLLRGEANFDDILSKANQVLKQYSHREDTINEIDDDWLYRFCDTARDTSDEMIKDILANILCGKLMDCKSSNRRLLDFLKSTNKDELNTFFRFASISSNIGLYHMGSALAPGRLMKYGLPPCDIFRLSDVGLISADNMRCIPLEDSNTIEYMDRKIRITNKNGQKMELNIYQLTGMGEQLYNFSEPYIKYGAKREQYFRDFRKYLEDRGCSVIENKIG